MRLIKTKNRDYENIDNAKQIEKIVKNYIDLEKIYFKTNNTDYQLKFFDFVDNSFVLNFNEPLKDENIVIYTVKQKYIEFSVKVSYQLKEPYPENSYKLKVLSCKIAKVERKFDRISFESSKLHLKNFILPILIENQPDLIKNITFKILLMDLEKKLDKYSFCKVYFFNDHDIPPEVKFVTETDIMLYLDNTNKLRNLIEQNNVFFHQREDLKKELTKRVGLLQSKYKSMLVMPIEYLTIKGKKIVLGHIMIADNNFKINEDTILEVRELCDQIFEKINRSNLKEYSAKEDICNISTHGAQIKVKNREIIDNIIHQEALMFNIVFRFQKPILASGDIIYIQENEDKSCLIGIDFSNSRYGEKLKRVIDMNIKNLAESD